MGGTGFWSAVVPTIVVRFLDGWVNLEMYSRFEWSGLHHTCVEDPILFSDFASHRDAITN